MTATLTSQLTIRWAIHRDITALLDIDCRAFDVPWTEQQFEWTKPKPPKNLVVFAAEYNERIVGYMAYLLCPPYLPIVRMAVDYDFRRQGIGRALLAKLTGKATGVRYAYVTARVPEDSLEAQVFLRACGFRAVGLCEDSGTIDFTWCQKVRIAT